MLTYHAIQARLEKGPMSVRDLRRRLWRRRDFDEVYNELLAENRIRETGLGTPKNPKVVALSTWTPPPPKHRFAICLEALGIPAPLLLDFAVKCSNPIHQIRKWIEIYCANPPSDEPSKRPGGRDEIPF